MFHIRKYWEVVVWYNLDYNLFSLVERDLARVGVVGASLNYLHYNMRNGAKAVTCSSLDRCLSVVLFNRHIDKADCINSIVHEAEHIKQAVLDRYDIEDTGESPAYTIGYIIERMWEVCNRFICH